LFVSFEGWGVMDEGNWRAQRKPSIGRTVLRYQRGNQKL